MSSGRKIITPEIQEKIRSLKDNGITNADISQRFGISVQSVKNIKRQTNIDPEKHSIAPKIERPQKTPYKFHKAIFDKPLPDKNSCQYPKKINDSPNEINHIWCNKKGNLQKGMCGEHHDLCYYDYIARGRRILI